MQEFPILEIKNYSLGIEIDKKIYPILKNINFSFFKGKIHAIVGESGCGKTMSVMSILKLLPKNSKVLGGKIVFEGQNILSYSEKQMRQIRGRKIALIPQDPMTSLNPLYTIENQLLEVIMLHNDISKEQALKVAIQTLESVEFKDAEKRIKSYPHELSGGMKQRVIIAMALAANADILIADEPTTALDVTIQAQILKLLEKIKLQGKTIVLITHDLGVVAQYSDDISIMYLGAIVERAQTRELFKNPHHPYTKALIEALPVKKGKKLKNIKGQPSQITQIIEGCPFNPRCEKADYMCHTKMPELTNISNSNVSCHHPY
ncbi:TPA: ABC transporter ATP-binding protein [Candidatus Galligastranaerophilus intestinavium]|uniref:ABC transporter ATP-binding protein n=1 Tax=Candidatus Galligastranaerophilus intestinavium TaxID=2840836 RepID=A0A9D1JXX2_9BACT|nr:ABC transporter ATP-binding protein [Candidatus Galligastranaerophilus intestinavium]